MVVTVVDEGFNPEHPEIKANYVSCALFLIITLYLYHLTQGFFVIIIISHSMHDFLSLITEIP